MSQENYNEERTKLECWVSVDQIAGGSYGIIEERKTLLLGGYICRIKKRHGNGSVTATQGPASSLYQKNCIPLTVDSSVCVCVCVQNVLEQGAQIHVSI